MELREWTHEPYFLITRPEGEVTKKCDNIFVESSFWHSEMAKRTETRLLGPYDAWRSALRGMGPTNLPRNGFQLNPLSGSPRFSKMPKGNFDYVLNMLKRYRRPGIVIPALALVAIVGAQLVLRVIHWHDLQYGSREQITQTLLEATPLVTDRHIVRQFVGSKGWGRGGRIRSTAGPDGEPVDRISVYLGEAVGLIVDERVYAEWIFDAEEKLVNVDVYKITLVP